MTNDKFNVSNGAGVFEYFYLMDYLDLEEHLTSLSSTYHSDA